ncbi:MAG: citrate lyase subunit alpha [Acholeplasma sp.]|jgi:citrate lyase subunit alpha/citrate CoA-transferase|nr:MAG: citrate lyase subunit alpha [Acholeplasma sp.]
MKNSLGRAVPDDIIPFRGTQAIIQTQERKLIRKEMTYEGIKPVFHTLDDLFSFLDPKDGMTFSFHHHLRNGDGVINLIVHHLEKTQLKNLTFAPSAIFPIHEPMGKLIKNGQITKIVTNYLNGPVAKVVEQGYLKDLLVMDTHGGRPRAIESGELKIDIAFIAAPAVDPNGNANGIEGVSACGTLGYAFPDLWYAKKKILVTDHLIPTLKQIDLEGIYVDAILVVDSIGDPQGIQSGTTKPTRDPIQLKIAKQTARLMDELGAIHDQMSFQTGAGGTSLAVAESLKKIMKERNIRGSFASGGITNFLVNMHEKGFFEHLYDVQCFDLEAIESYGRNPNHHLMDASTYGNPYDHPMVNKLDVVILGATEIDLDFNVNVSTDSHGHIMGGSGGHSDTAEGAKLTIITTNLVKSRLSMVKEHVTSVTTPGDSVDVLVTERGIAINPRRKDLLEKLKNSSLPILTIQELLNQAYQMTGIPKKIKKSSQFIGVIRYRDGSIIDSLYQVKGD